MNRPIVTSNGHRSESGVDTVALTIDGQQVWVPAGTLLIRAADALGIEIPRFCDHPLLEPVGACRQCLVEVVGQRKPVTACTTTVSQGMVARTQFASPLADKAQQGVMELLLINHPLDCPVCDKGGECPLQNQAMDRAAPDSRFTGPKRTFPKPIAISERILLDRERCVQCARCTRFASQIAGDATLELLDRGSNQQVGVADGAPFKSYFSGNTIQICPVGALTSVDYRFRSRPFDLVSTPGVCEHCASGCAIRTDVRRGAVLRRMAAGDPEVNEEWNCDKGRWGFGYLTDERLDEPRARNARQDDWDPVSWSRAFNLAARGLTWAAGRSAVLTGGRLTVEDAYAYAKFARVALGTNDIDFRARPLSGEETEFLAAHVAGKRGPSYADLDNAPAVLLVGFEPEEESPIVFLRLRKAVRTRGARVFSVAPFTTRGLRKLDGTLLRSSPGWEPHVLGGLMAAGHDVPGVSPADLTEAAELLNAPGSVILAGERLAQVPGALSAVARLAALSGARLGWIPRRAGDRGAVDAGVVPNLLPGGRPVSDRRARAELAVAWSAGDLPEAPGRDAEQILAAAAAGRIDALVVAGVDVADLADPQAALRAFKRVPFLVSLELRETPVTRLAHLSLPVPAVTEKAGSFVNWEGRHRPFTAALPQSDTMSDLRVLHGIARSMGIDLGLPSADAAWRELSGLGDWAGERSTGPRVNPPAHLPMPDCGAAVLATWRLLLDEGSLQTGDGAPPATALLAPQTAEEIGASDGDLVTISTDRGSMTLPVGHADLPERVVWAPTNSTTPGLENALGAAAGDVVRLATVAERGGRAA